ncbi:alpha/beta hydrolase family protein [Raineya orbicola]|jgi:dipeptidyl aminopeptidase/acylaminoacyl peptidase|uniref:Prolyl oligopeptidase n=1 Tax=Raineya orbicola TaxID=2016530 RepID=A0A2N3IKK4_9BACT|nr:prolyl oligopeptidase family serine peptidase [Raineya orbicola]PKQ70866.1 Prolyl oligopeptidase [Raineya orbicola]
MQKKSLILLFLVGYFFQVFAQEDLKYQKPSAPILALADYERPPSISMDKDKNYMLLLYRDTYKSLDELNQDELRLAGLRINPNLFVSSTMNYVKNLKIRKVKDVKAEPTPVKGLPSNAKISFITWSPDYKKIAFTHTTEKGVELWWIDVSSAQAQKITEATLNASVGSPFVWYKDSEHLLVKFIPEPRPQLIDKSKETPKGPIVSVAEGKASQNRTFQDLLKNKIDEQNFESLLSSQLFKVHISGTKNLLKDKELYVGMSFSPDGNYLMLTNLQKPFSYLVPYNRFPQISKVYDNKGNLIKVVNEVPLNEIMPKGFSAVRKGKRNMAWRDDMPATLYFVEALDEGDPAKKVEYRDEIFVWQAPFDKDPVSIAKTQQRFAGIIWGNEQVAIMYDSWYDTRNQKTYLINPSQPNLSARVIADRNYQDLYNDPGRFSTQINQFGQEVLAIENNKLFLIGEGFSPKGQFPFIDELDLKTLKKQRLYQSAFTDKKEDIVSIEDHKAGVALVQIQSPTEYPNYFLRNYKKRIAPVQITFTPNPFESIKNIKKQVIKYKRNDGLELSGTLYLPLGYDENKKEKLPLLIWAYPREYKDMQTAGQSNQNPNEFTFPNYGSFIYWVTKGYVVLDDASFPIVGEGSQEPNDTFIEQLVANAKAAIDAVDNLGYIDRNKVAIGGHSYGAFMTANLLAHSDLFVCGVARSGAYNRTLTPFGFQSEQRNYWDAPEVYNKMSPFMNAHKIKKPILLIHGEADNNPGTFTLQTERLFQAIKGLGGTARMVILPRESHGYVAKESILHVLWEQEQFLDKHLKGVNK